MVISIRQSRFIRAKELFPGSEVVRMHSFDMIGARDNCALLAIANQRLTQVASVFWAESANLFEYDCFECLSPHILAA